jgi:hypothetical protein
MLANGQENAFTECRERRTSALDAAKRHKHAVGPSAVLVTEQFQWQSVAGQRSMRRACRAKSIKLSSGRVSATKAHTGAERSCKRVWSVEGGRGAGRLVRLLCAPAQVTRTRWHRTSTARGFVVGRTSDAQRATGYGRSTGGGLHA